MKMWIARDLVGIAKGSNPQLILSEEKPVLMPERRLGMFFCDGFYVSLPKDWFPEVTFENSPMEVRLMREDVVEANYKAIADYEDFLGLVAFMRKAQKEANDMIAQVECYQEAQDYIKKAEELEQMVDKWLEENV